MNYKKLIDMLRAPNRDSLVSSEDAATAIETLLAEREAAMKHIPHNCQTCKWWEAVKPGMACCKAPDDAGPCYLGRGEAWQWRGPTPTYRTAGEAGGSADQESQNQHAAGVCAALADMPLQEVGGDNGKSAAG